MYVYFLFQMCLNMSLSTDRWLGWMWSYINVPVFDKWNIHALDVCYIMYITLTIKECNTIKSLGAVTVLCDMMINNHFCMNLKPFYPHNQKKKKTFPHITFYTPWAEGDMKTVLYESVRGTFLLTLISFH